MISVIIPALNEAGRLPGLLDTLRAQAGPFEIIVVDGGSADDTAERAIAGGAELILARRGRGHQLRAGAAHAKGDVLLFLHADSVFPDDGLAAIVDALNRNPAAVGGNFRLHFDGDDPFSRWLDGFYAWIRRHGVYYGDSGMFVRRRAYDALGGMRELELMEDFDFNRRLEKFGTTVCIDAPPLITSARRFGDRHPAAIIFGWLWIHALYYLGVPGTFMARQYDSVRHRQKSAPKAETGR